MLLEYHYQGHDYQLFVQWTADTERSTVFGNIAQQVAVRHRGSTSSFEALAEHLDALTDKLYEQLYIFTDEHVGIPYNPRFRRMVMQPLSEINGLIQEQAERNRYDSDMLLTALFSLVADKLRETVNIYLADSAYQCKFRERLRDKEQYLETTPSNQITADFEDILLRMTDLSYLMDECLSETQRRRLVKHIFLSYTLQEIADQEQVSYQSVQESIASALRKMKKALT